MPMFINNQSLKAQWGYKAIHRDEITFKKGAVVTFIRQDVNNKDWLIVKTRRGTVGLVPATYFRLTKSAKSTNVESTGSCSKGNKGKTDDNNCKGSDNAPRVDIRIRIIQEMVQTEQQYNKKLAVLMESYKKPLEAMLDEEPLLEQEEIDLLFKSVPVILTMSSAFLTGLKRAKCKNIGKLFLEFAPCLRAYSPFLGSYRASIQTLQALQTDKARKSKWLEFLAERPHNLEQLLIEPAQRIPRYELLLKELNKHTEEGHPEKADIKRAQEEVHASALQNDRDIACDNILQWQYRPSPKDTWISLSDRQSDVLSKANRVGMTHVQMSSQEESWEVDLKAMMRRREGKGVKQPLRIILRDKPTKPRAPAEPVLTSPSLVEHVRTTTDGSRLRMRIPGHGWVQLRAKQLMDILRPQPKYFHRAGMKGKWLYIPSNPKAEHCDIGVLKSDNPSENISVSRSDSGMYARSASNLPSPTARPNIEGILPPPLPPKPTSLWGGDKDNCLSPSLTPKSPYPSSAGGDFLKSPLSVKEKARMVGCVINRSLRTQISKHGRPSRSPGADMTGSKNKFKKSPPALPVFRKTPR